MFKQSIHGLDEYIELSYVNRGWGLVGYYLAFYSQIKGDNACVTLGVF